MKKKTNKKKEKQKEKKNIDILDVVMIGIIILLGFYIVYLGFQLKNKTSKPEEKKANIVFPVTEKGTSSGITLSMNEFKKGSEYVFKVTNYRQNIIAKEKIQYLITVSNEDLTDISIYKEGSDKDLAKNENEFLIENNYLKAEKEQTDIYKVKLNSKKNLKKDSKVIIKVDS